MRHPVSIEIATVQIRSLSDIILLKSLLTVFLTIIMACHCSGRRGFMPFLWALMEWNISKLVRNDDKFFIFLCYIMVNVTEFEIADLQTLRQKQCKYLQGILFGLEIISLTVIHDTV